MTSSVGEEWESFGRKNLRQDDEAFLHISNTIFDSISKQSDDPLSFENTLMNFSRKLRNSFVDAARYRMSLLPTFAETGEANLPKITRKAAKLCQNMYLSTPSFDEESRNDKKQTFTPKSSENRQSNDGRGWENKNSPRRHRTNAQSIRSTATLESINGGHDLQRRHLQSAQNEGNVFNHSPSSKSLSSEYGADRSTHENESEYSINLNHEEETEFEMQRMDITNRKCTLAYNEAQIIKQQSRVRQHLMDEMRHANEVLKKTRDLELRSAYQKHILELESGLEKWTQTSPSGPFPQKKAGIDGVCTGAFDQLIKFPKVGTPVLPLEQRNDTSAKIANAFNRVENISFKSDQVSHHDSTGKYHEPELVGSAILTTQLHNSIDRNTGSAFPQSQTQHVSDLNHPAAVVSGQQAEQLSVMTNSSSKKRRVFFPDSPSEHNAEQAGETNMQSKHCDKTLPAQIRTQTPGGENSSTEKMRIVKVQAPENLPESYRFEANLGEESFMVIVPKGGVRKGQIFTSPVLGSDNDRQYTKMKSNNSLLSDSKKWMNEHKNAKMVTPIGYWRNNIWDCLSDGIDHPMLLNSCFCPHIALAQIMMRLRLNSFGERVSTSSEALSVNHVLPLQFLFIFLHGIVLYYCLWEIRSLTEILILSLPMVLLDTSIYIYILYLMVRARQVIRAECSIPEYQCQNINDISMAMFCTSCIVSQMGRHTAEYKTYRALCCSETGLPCHVDCDLSESNMAGLQIL